MWTQHHERTTSNESTNESYNFFLFQIQLMMRIRKKNGFGLQYLCVYALLLMWKDCLATFETILEMETSKFSGLIESSAKGLPAPALHIPQPERCRRDTKWEATWEKIKDYVKKTKRFSLPLVQHGFKTSFSLFAIWFFDVFKYWLFWSIAHLHIRIVFPRNLKPFPATTQRGHCIATAPTFMSPARSIFFSYTPCHGQSNTMQKTIGLLTLRLSVPYLNVTRIGHLHAFIKVCQPFVLGTPASKFSTSDRDVSSFLGTKASYSTNSRPICATDECKRNCFSTDFFWSNPNDLFGFQLEVIELLNAWFLSMFFFLHMTVSSNGNPSFWSSKSSFGVSTRQGTKSSAARHMSRLYWNSNPQSFKYQLT